eukprot:452667_1
MTTKQYEIIDIFSIISHLIILIMIICVGVHGLIGFHKSTTIINIFTYLFIFSLFISSIYIILAVVNDILYIEDKHFIEERILTAISHEAYMLLLLTLLATLISRLYFTFHASIYAISNAQLFCIIASYILAVILAISYMWFTIAIVYGSDYQIVVYGVIGTMGIVYVILTIYTTALFVRALFKLTTLRAISISNITKKNKIKLNKQQIEMMTKASRYISLISLALLTSCIRFLLAACITFIQTTEEQKQKISKMLNSLLFSTDCLINVLCLHLQYQFAKKYYDKYCKILENSWRSILILCAETTMNKRYKTETKSETSECEDEQCTSEVKEMNDVIDNGYATPDVEKYMPHGFGLNDDVANMEECVSYVLSLNVMHSTRL